MIILVVILRLGIPRHLFQTVIVKIICSEFFLDSYKNVFVAVSVTETSPGSFHSLSHLCVHRAFCISPESSKL